MSAQTQYLKGILLVLISAVCFSVSGTLQALAPEEATPFVITEMRMIIGAAFLFLWCLCFGKLPAWGVRIPWRPLFICAFFLLIGQLCFFSGMKFLGVAAGAVISIGSAPIFAALFAWIFFRITPSFIWAAATTAAITGVVLINGFNLDSSRLTFIGILLLDGLTYAAYISYSSRINFNIDSDFCVMLILSIIAIALSPVLFLYPTEWVISSWRGFGVCLGLGVFTGGVAFAFLTAGARLISSNTASTLCLAEPLGAVCWGIFLLKEQLSISNLVGVMLILCAIILLLFDKTEQKEPSVA